MATVSTRDEVTELLQELIRVDTTNPPGNETAAAELLRSYLEESGAQVDLKAPAPVGEFVEIEAGPDSATARCGGQVVAECRT